jgi:hypothetical protein
MKEKIDFVVSWLDSNDPLWQEDFLKYKGMEQDGNTDKCRFRDWGCFHFWFRAVEKYASWVNKVFLVTNGIFPKWINTNHPKLVLVRHSDYIDESNLPTFNSHTIELNLHRIKGLSEHFVYFNDDMYLNHPVTPEYYFKKGLPCDFNEETIFNVPIYSIANQFDIYSIILADLGIINAHFRRNQTARQAWRKWFGPHLGFTRSLISLSLSNFELFVGFRWRHNEIAYLKSIYEEVWKNYPTILEQSCSRFRKEATLNQYVFRYWQLASNKFHPVKSNTFKCLTISKAYKDCIEKVLQDPKIKSVCLNDTPWCSEEEFMEIKEWLQGLMGTKFPKKSSFEI